MDRLVKESYMHTQRYICPAEIELIQEFNHDNFGFHQREILSDAASASRGERNVRIRLNWVFSFGIPSIRIENFWMIIVFRIIAKSYDTCTEYMAFRNLIWTYFDIFPRHSEQNSNCRWPHSQTFINKLACKLEFLY